MSVAPVTNDDFVTPYSVQQTSKYFGVSALVLSPFCPHVAISCAGFAFALNYVGKKWEDSTRELQARHISEMEVEKTATAEFLAQSYQVQKEADAADQIAQAVLDTKIKHSEEQFTNGLIKILFGLECTIMVEPTVGLTVAATGVADVIDAYLSDPTPSEDRED